MADAPAGDAAAAQKQATDELALAKARAEVRKLEADADTAQTAARGASLKAALGEVPASGFTGAVTPGDGAALAEANLLSREDLGKVAAAIAGHVARCAGGSTLYLSSADTPPTCAAATTHGMRVALVRKSLNDSLSMSRTIWPEGDPATGEASKTVSFTGGLAAAGLILSGANALLSYFKTDYSIGGRDLQPVQRPLLMAVAHHLAAKVDLRLEGVEPIPAQATRDALTDGLSVLSELASDARRRMAHHASELKRLVPAPPVVPVVPPQPYVDPDPKNEAPGHDQALAALTAAVGLFDALVAAVLTVTNGTIALEQIARDQELLAFLASDGAAFASVKVDGAFSSTVTEKKFLGGLRGLIPYRISTVMVASWKCERAASGKVLGAGVEHHHTKSTAFNAIG